MASLPYFRQAIRPFTTSMTVTSSSRVVVPSSSAAAFSTSSTQRALKESDRDREDLHDHYEQHKDENLKDVKAGKAYWREQLASESEAGVKADRGEASSTAEDIKKLQEEAVKGQKK